MFPEVSKITVERALRRLCDDGNVETIGSGRASKYIGGGEQQSAWQIAMIRILDTSISYRSHDVLWRAPMRR